MSDVDLVRAYQARYGRIRTSAAARASQLWIATGGVTEAAVDAYVPSAVALSAGAERATSSTVAGYVGAMSGQRERLDLDETTGESLRGVAPAEVFLRPVVTARTALSEGKSFAEAMELGRQRASALTETNTVLSQRAAITRLSPAGYRRVLTGKSCALCATASTQRYKRSNLLPIHDHCDCSIAPIIGDRDPGHVINKSLLRDLRSAGGSKYWNDRGVTVENGRVLKNGQPLDVETRTHGELGPVLVDGRQAFTGPAGLAA